jgi:hypothetical protein
MIVRRRLPCESLEPLRAAVHARRWAVRELYAVAPRRDNRACSGVAPVA